MARKSNMAKKAAGIALLVIGIGLGYWGHQLSGSIGSQISRTITGSHTDKVMYTYIGGVASFVVGLFVLFKK